MQVLFQGTMTKCVFKCHLKTFTKKAKKQLAGKRQK